VFFFFCLENREQITSMSLCRVMWKGNLMYSTNLQWGAGLAQAV
jgi:hypothetical protein